MGLFDFYCPGCGAESTRIIRNERSAPPLCPCGRVLRRKPSVGPISARFKGDGFTTKPAEYSGDIDTPEGLFGEGVLDD